MRQPRKAAAFRLLAGTATATGSVFASSLAVPCDYCPGGKAGNRQAPTGHPAIIGQRSRLKAGGLIFIMPIRVAVVGGIAADRMFRAALAVKMDRISGLDGFTTSATSPGIAGNHRFQEAPPFNANGSTGSAITTLAVGCLRAIQFTTSAGSASNVNAVGNVDVPKTLI